VEEGRGRITRKQKGAVELEMEKKTKSENHFQLAVYPKVVKTLKITASSSTCKTLVS
jgi:hypothetical protein